MRVATWRQISLRGRHLWVVLLILEAHGPLDFRAAIDKVAQRIARQRVIVPARVHIFKLAGLMIMPLRVRAVKDEAFDFVGRIQRVAALLVQALRIPLQNSANIGAVRGAVLIDHLAEDHHLAGAEDIARAPVKGAPIHVQAKIALALRGEPADRRSVEGQIVPALDKKLLVVIEHVEAPFQIAEQDGDRFDALFVRQVPEALLLNLVHGYAALPLRLGSQIQFFQLPVGERQKVLEFIGCHGLSFHCA
jgi:hypothetical protein